MELGSANSEKPLKVFKKMRGKNKSTLGRIIGEWKAYR